MYMYMYMYMYQVGAGVGGTSMCVCIYIYIWMCICMYVFMYVFMCVCVCVCVCVYIYTHTHIHTYIHIYIHTYIYIYIYICRCNFSRLRHLRGVRRYGEWVGPIPFWHVSSSSYDMYPPPHMTGTESEWGLSPFDMYPPPHMTRILLLIWQVQRVSGAYPRLTNCWDEVALKMISRSLDLDLGVSSSLCWLWSSCSSSRSWSCLWRPTWRMSMVNMCSYSWYVGWRKCKVGFFKVYIMPISGGPHDVCR